MSWYNHERPHQALQYRSPRQYRREQAAKVALFRGSTTNRAGSWSRPFQICGEFLATEEGGCYSSL
jgi:hypothetical protein